MNTVAIACITLGAFFDLHTIPLDQPSEKKAPSLATLFFAQADDDKVADLFVLQGNKLLVVPRSGTIRQAEFPEGVSVFDIFASEGRSVADAIAVQGRRIVRIPLVLQGETREPQTLFEADSLYSSAVNGPVPSVLIITDASSSKKTIALPTNDGISLLGLDGTLVGQKPFTKSSARFHTEGRLNDAEYNALNLNFYQSSWNEITGAPFSTPKPEIETMSDAPHASSLRKAADRKPELWPWFLVHKEKTKAIGVCCAVDDSLNTLICSCDATVSADGSLENVSAPGPERRYPGALVASNSEMPDFNGDGYKDLLLWNASRPGISVDALLRAVVGRNWPITLTVHTYSPEKGRFEPAAATSLTYRIPVTWFLTGATPLRCPVLADFNGDHKTDLGMCTQENEFSVWLYSDGFAGEPDEKHTFTENITKVELTGDVAGNGKTSVVLRSDHHIYALYAK